MAENTEVLKIIKDKDHYKFSVEIKESAKGDIQVSVSSHSDDSPEIAGKLALAEYQRIKKELAK